MSGIQGPIPPASGGTKLALAPDGTGSAGKASHLPPLQSPPSHGDSATHSSPRVHPSVPAVMPFPAQDTNPNKYAERYEDYHRRHQDTLSIHDQVAIINDKKSTPEQKRAAADKLTAYSPRIEVTESEGKFRFTCRFRGREYANMSPSETMGYCIKSVESGATHLAILTQLKELEAALKDKSLPPESRRVNEAKLREFELEYADSSSNLLGLYRSSADALTQLTSGRQISRQEQASAAKRLQAVGVQIEVGPDGKYTFILGSGSDARRFSAAQVNELRRALDSRRTEQFSTGSSWMQGKLAEVRALVKAQKEIRASAASATAAIKKTADKMVDIGLVMGTKPGTSEEIAAARGRVEQRYGTLDPQTLREKQAGLREYLDLHVRYYAALQEKAKLNGCKLRSLDEVFAEGALAEDPDLRAEVDGAIAIADQIAAGTPEVERAYIDARTANGEDPDAAKADFHRISQEGTELGHRLTNDELLTVVAGALTNTDRMAQGPGESRLTELSTAAARAVSGVQQSATPPLEGDQLSGLSPGSNRFGSSATEAQAEDDATADERRQVAQAIEAKEQQQLATVEVRQQWQRVALAQQEHDEQHEQQEQASEKAARERRLAVGKDLVETIHRDVVNDPRQAKPDQ